ncbi:MAG: hypothetical protein IIX86_10170 [Clostridia bacterium]|nr:hypothetical protein [Clostridia bacterium]
MELYQDTSGMSEVVNAAEKIVNTADKVVGFARNTSALGKRVGKMKTSTKVGLLLGGVLVLSLLPLRLCYDRETGEGEFKSLAVSVKRTQRPAPATNGRTHDLVWEAFPTVRVKPRDVKPCELPPAQKKDAIRAIPVQAYKIQKAKPVVPVVLKVQEEKGR